MSSQVVVGFLLGECILRVDGFLCSRFRQSPGIMTRRRPRDSPTALWSKTGNITLEAKGYGFDCTHVCSFLCMCVCLCDALRDAKIEIFWRVCKFELLKEPSITPFTFICEQTIVGCHSLPYHWVCLKKKSQINLILIVPLLCDNYRHMRNYESHNLFFCECDLILIVN